MSQTAGAISDLISVPKGGGAQTGLAEKFSADLHTGTGNFPVPVAVPPRRNGLHPQLSLGYSTGSGNSPFGLGSALSVPGVSRLTSQGVPRYRDGSADEQDIFVLSGAEDLVEIESGATDRGAGIKRYRPRTEGLIAQILESPIGCSAAAPASLLASMSLTRCALHSASNTALLGPSNHRPTAWSSASTDDSRRCCARTASTAPTICTRRFTATSGVQRATAAESRGHIAPIEALKRWRSSHAHLFNKSVGNRPGPNT